MENTWTPRHPIRVVAHRTGLTPATIRAWELRYDAVSPQRSEGGHRLYSDHDVARLRTLRELTRAGRSISMVAELSPQAATDLLVEDRSSSIKGRPAGSLSEPVAWVEEAYAQIEALDARGLESALWRAVMALGARAFLKDVAASLLSRIGAGRETGVITPGQEHFGSEVLERMLEGLADRSKISGGPPMVVCTLPGERHGLSARLVSVAALLDGWNVTYLGTDLPVDDIAATAEGLHAVAVAVAISAVHREDPHRTLTSLIALRARMNPTVRIIVGGGGARLLDRGKLPDGVHVFDGLDGLGEISMASRGPSGT